MSVLVYVENWDGKFKKQSYELISYASQVGSLMNAPVIAISVGKVDQKELESLSQYGVAKIISVTGDNLNILDSQVYSAVISEYARQSDARVIILSNNNSGKAIAPRLSVRLKAGLGSGVSRLPLSIDPFIVYKRVYSGNGFGLIRINSQIRIITLAQNSFGVFDNPVAPAIEIFTPGQEIAKTQVLEVQKQTGKILLTDAEIVVSGGRGMKSPGNWTPLLDLAAVLGAATACSRPVSDEGWRPHEEHTGQTGKIIAPNLYFAIGISGATQHLAGVSSSKYIVAINTDKGAPIFEAAQYGIIGDAMKILPKLTEAFREAKGK